MGSAVDGAPSGHPRRLRRTGHRAGAAVAAAALLASGALGGAAWGFGRGGLARSAAVAGSAAAAARTGSGAPGAGAARPGAAGPSTPTTKSRPLPTSGSPGRGATASSSFGSLRVVQRRIIRRAPVDGPTDISASFSRPTTSGDLLVAAIGCGVLTGMTVPRLSFPPHWRQGRLTIDGIQAGLETAIYFYPDNPGGITRFDVGTIRRKMEADCTVYLLELAGASPDTSLATQGWGGGDWETEVTVRTAGRAAPGDLVLLVTSDGTEVHDNHYRVSNGFQPVFVQPDGNPYQPGVFAERVAAGGVQSATVSWSAGDEDNCGSIIALDVR